MNRFFQKGSGMLFSSLFLGGTGATMAYIYYKRNTQNHLCQNIPENRKFILAGDIGGTNARMTLKSINPSNREERETIHYLKAEANSFASIEDLLNTFLKDYKGTDKYPTVVVMALAGPRKGQMQSITNCKWPDFNIQKLGKKMKFSKFRVLNDFEANGYGILAMKEEHYTKVNKAPIQDGCPKALIGAGTGLGEAFLTKGVGGQFYDVFPCEGGHTCFAPRNLKEFNFMQFIKEWYLKNKKETLNRVSVERCCSGLAIIPMFEYLQKEFPDIESPVAQKVKLMKKDTEKNDIIIASGKDKSDKICEKVVELFLEIYGAEAGNQALKTLPYGGLYLLSGITQGLKMEILKRPTFMNNFCAKGRMKGLMEKVPIFIVDAEIGLLGSEECAIRYI